MTDRPIFKHAKAIAGLATKLSNARAAAAKLVAINGLEKSEVKAIQIINAKIVHAHSEAKWLRDKIKTEMNKNLC